MIDLMEGFRHGITDVVSQVILLMLCVDDINLLDDWALGLSDRDFIFLCQRIALAGEHYKKLSFDAECN